MASHIGGDRAHIRRSRRRITGARRRGGRDDGFRQGVLRATGMLATVDGVSSIQQLDDDDTE